MRQAVSFVVVVFGFAVSLASAASQPTAGPTALVRVERHAEDDLVRLRRAGVPVVGETLDGLLVEGPYETLARLERLGHDYRVLDGNTADARILVVKLDDERTLETVAAHGTVLLHEDNLALVRVAPDAALPPALRPGCFAVDDLNRKPIALPRFVPPSPSRARAETAGQPDPVVEKVVGLVDDAAIHATWEDVTANPPSGTRFSTAVGCQDAADYCYDHYVGLGLSPEYDSWDAAHASNVVAEMAGAIDPDEIYIIVGHLDDLPSSGIAPGADDNASGTVTVLEAARAMSCWSTRNTVRFLNVTGEEQGLLGSEAYAEAASLAGEDIRGVLNFDMNGWEGNGAPDPEDLDVSYNSFSQWLGEMYAEAATTYQTGLVVDAFSCPSLTASDHASFWREGYPAIIGITDNQGYCGHGGTYPDYHESTDTIAACGDPKFFYATVRTAVATLAELAEPFVVTFDRGAYACDGTARVVVGDPGLNLDPGVQETVQVTVWSDTEPGGEAIVLTEQGTDSDLFAGDVGLTVASPVGGDGLLSVVEGGAVHTEYVDPLDCAGGVDVPYAATATIDCTAPAIDGIDETGISDTQATIVWTTNEQTSGHVVWGETVPPGEIAPGPEDAVTHAVTLTGLQECTVYRYEVRAQDEAGNTAVADNGGQFYAFETLGDFGQGLQPCHAGQVDFDDVVFSCTGDARFHVVDLDLNLDPLAVDTAVVRLTSTTETAEETVVVTETGPNTSRFEGSIQTTADAAIADGRLQTAHDDVVTVTYDDADNGTGTAGLSYATAAIDCAGPVISDLRIESITDARATVAFTTDEPGNAVVEWGASEALGDTSVGAVQQTAHAVVLEPLAACADAFLRVRASDRFGHETVADDHGVPYRFAAGTIPGLYWKDDFESGGVGWTLEGEWEVGAPQGAGGSSGNSDPTEAYNADAVLGHDLSGQGVFAGDFEPNISETATSPQLDASTWTNTKLLLYRRLNTGSTDDASIVVSIPQGYPIYRSYGSAVLEQSFAVQSFDLSALVDGKKRVTVAFGQSSGTTGQYSGWNVDDVIFKDGSLPDYGPCGSCGAAPSFAGAVAASDDDPCLDGGVTVDWNGAVSWGSGASGTYAVYRGDAPGFVPSAANLLAAGIVGSTYTDTTLAPDQTATYLVRAENDETCSGGPANGGVTDANESYVTATNWTSRPVPGAITGLSVDRIGAAHLRLAWTSDADAAAYRVYRSGAPDPATFAQIADEPQARHDDLDAGADRETYYYLVRGANACGQAGP